MLMTDTASGAASTTTLTMMRASAFFFGCVLLLSCRNPDNIYTSAQSDGALWSDNSGNGNNNNQYSINTVTTYARTDTHPETAKTILRQVYAAAGGSEWIESSGWNSDGGEVCTWKGVFCYDGTSYPDRKGHVQQIDLGNNNLDGSLPSTVFGLPYLESLSFEGNPDLEVDLSNGLSSAQFLRSLALTRTRVTNLSRWNPPPALEFLQIADTGQTGTMDAVGWNLPNLKVLHASDNAWTGPLPDSIGVMNQLEELDLSRNSLTGQLPNDALGKLSLLQILSLTNNAFSGTLPTEALEKLTNLRTVSIQRIPFDGNLDALPGPGIRGRVPAFRNHRRLTKIQLENQLLGGSLDPDFLLSAPTAEPIEVDLRNNAINGKVSAKSLLNKRYLELYLGANAIEDVDRAIFDISTNSCPRITDWMGGDIQTVGCQAFLCPPGTWAPEGRGTTSARCQGCGDPNALSWGRNWCSSALSGTEQERDILAKLYNALGGRDWKFDDNWMDSSQNICGWYGISCDSVTGQVVSVVLRNNGLTGMIPSELFDLPALQILNLESNKIEIDFAAVAMATNLESLDLTATGIRFLNTLQNLSGLPNFRFLALGTNGLTGPIPEAVFSITSLEDLDLSYNDFTGSIGPGIQNLRNLKRFNCDGADLTGTLPTEIGSLTNLEEFSAVDNEFSGSIPNVFNSLTKLRTLDLQRTVNTGSGISGPLPSFTNLEQLTSIYLDGNMLTGTLPSNFLINNRRLQSYIEVGLSNNRLQGVVPDGWSRFGELFVDLADNQISGIPDSLCSKYNWMNGAVQNFGCNAILCPVGTYNTIGYQADATSSCLNCPSSTSYGATFCGSGQGTADVSSELNILLAVFGATGGNDWNDKAGWDTSTDYCNSFYGVKCDGAGRVITLDLKANNLKGTIPKSVFQLMSLRELFLSDNHVQLTFDGIATAKKLIGMHLDNTNIDSLLGVGESPNLQTLNVAGNNLGGAVPSDIYRIIALKTLNLGDNSFSGSLDDVVGGLKSLESLILYHNQFTGRIPASIGDLSNLEVLNLAENNFEGTIPDELNDLTNLKFLSLQREGGIFGYSDIGINQGKSSLSGLGLTGSLPSFDRLTLISHLYLGVNSLTGTVPYNFLGGVESKALQIQVDLTSNSLTGTLPASLTQFDNMALYAAGNRITAIADGLCSKSGWMGGAVAGFKCDGILCPAGTYNEIGRKSGSAPSCQSCGTGANGYFGSFDCLSSDEAKEGAEREILEKLYYAMDGPNWIDNSNWLDRDESICNWKGIQCDSQIDKSVTSIDLSYNGLKNEFPSRTFKLPNLKELNLQGNDVKFDFAGIQNAVNLELLDLEDTGLTSLFGIGQASNLKLLRADKNKFTSFPDEIFDLSNLEVLSLSNNMFSQRMMPNNLQIFNSMTYFACSGCGFTGPIPIWLSSMQSLQYLKLSRNVLTGTLPVELESMATLKHLDLSDQATFGVGLSGNLLSFSKQTELTELYLHHNNFQGAIPETFLSNVRNDQLVTVDLRYNVLGGAIPLQLGNINDLNIYLTSNIFETVPQSLCAKNWNDGDVVASNCDGLLCPPGTFNAYGRATNGLDCFECNNSANAQYMGHTFCGSALEHESLKVLYRSFGGPNWSSANNWLEIEDHCTWEGITCYTSGEFEGLVERIELADNNLVGDMPFALIWQLEGLNVVDLQKNDISLPFFMIGNAINLETIMLSYTRTNSLLGIGEAKSLKGLHLTSATLTGAIPDELFSLPNLESLFLSNNGISGTISPEFGQLKQLKNLYLLGNKLEGTIPTELGYLARLEHLSLGKNKLSGVIPRQITSLPLLEFLSLANEAGSANSMAGFSGALPALDGFPRIRELYLENNSFTGTIPDNFMQGIHDKTTQITIDLGFNNIVGSIPVELSSFDNLNLLLVGNEISDIPTKICSSNAGWMNGEVANSCDSILCPPGTFNSDGRQADTTTPCKTCTYPGSSRKYGSTSCNPGAGDALDDRSILFDLYDATDGDSWTTSTGWGSSEVAYCEWYGVTCVPTTSGDLRVTELNLANNNLNGLVPSKLFYLQGLKKLDVQQNSVSITFQDVDLASELEEIYIDETLVKNLYGVGGAPKLKVLHASTNSFGGQKIPDEIFQLSTLTNLNLADSMLVGTLSGKVGQFTELEIINLDGNYLSGEMPAELANLTGLRKIQMSNNKWTGTLPSSWVGMRSLEVVFINNFEEKTAGVTGPLAAFNTMPNIREVSLSNNQLTGSIPSNFLSGVADPNSLITVNLEQNHILGTIPSSLRIFSKLNIDITGNYITAIGDGLCSQPGWNDGNVGQFGCSGILCPPGTYNPFGRQTSSVETCEPCPGKELSEYLGDNTCATLIKLREQEILMKLFSATNGNDWKYSDSWSDTNTDVCSWGGIECGDRFTVESIDLGFNNLVGSVPTEIFKLQDLKSLWLYSNPVRFTFDGIGEATKLKSLRLDNTNLKSLSGIGSGMSLVDVDVGFNQLAGPIPTDLGELVNLESFGAAVNALVGPVPDFSASRKLSGVRLGDNQLTGTLPSFSRHSNIQHIDLSGNNLVGPIPSNFLETVGDETRLLVDLSGNKLTGTVPGSLGRMEDLTIYLRDNRIGGIDVALCSREGWNGGDVESFRCDGILCPAGTYAVYGRASHAGSPSCEPCDKNEYYGGSTCGGSAGTARRPAVVLVVLSVAGLLAALVW